MGNENLRRIRKAAGLSQWGLAAKADAAVSSICAAEKWGYRPGPGLREKIASALGVSEEELWSRVITGQRNQ